MHSDNQTQIRKMMGEFYKSEFNELALKYEKDIGKRIHKFSLWITLFSLNITHGL